MTFYKVATFEGVTMIYTEVGEEARWIPADPSNCDYQVYQRWLAEGNEPEEWAPGVSE